MERCVSGLNGNPGKVVYEKSYREFESPSLRLRYAEARQGTGELRHSFAIMKSARRFVKAFLPVYFIYCNY
jgi:hypothetical protein